MSLSSEQFKVKVWITTLQPLEQKLTLRLQKVMADILQSGSGVHIHMGYFSVQHYEICSLRTLIGHLLCRGGSNLQKSTPLVRIRSPYYFFIKKEIKNDRDDLNDNISPFIVFCLKTVEFKLPAPFFHPCFIMSTSFHFCVKMMILD